MSINKLDHVNIRTTQLNTMIKWYTDVLDLHSGDRPNFPFPGAWMYAGDSALVHLVGVDDTPSTESGTQPGTQSRTEKGLEHFALSATGAEEFICLLASKNIDYQPVELTEIQLLLINLWVPDDNHLRIDFPLDE